MNHIFKLIPNFILIIICGAKAQTSMPTSLFANTSDAVATAQLGKFYIISGFKPRSANSAVEIYDPITQRWDSRGCLYRINHNAAFIGDTLYIIGGTTDLGASVSQIEKYNITTKQWGVNDSMPEPRQQTASVSFGNTIIIAGGFSAGKPTDRVDIYNSSTGAWTRSKLSAPKTDMSAAVINNKAFFLGRANINNDTIDVYDNQVGAWSVIHFPRPINGVKLYSSSTKLIFISSFDANNALTGSIDIYDTDKKTWSVTTMPTPRYLYGAATTVTKLIIGGGNIKDGYPSTVVDIYDITSNKWTSTKLTQRRHNLCAAASGNLVLFAGGITDADPINPISQVVDIFDLTLSPVDEPISNSFSIYPNPVTQSLKFSLNNISILTDARLLITDMLGRKMIEKTFSSDELDVSNLTGGLYLLEIKGKDVNYVQKFIKQ